MFSGMSFLCSLGIMAATTMLYVMDPRETDACAVVRGISVVLGCLWVETVIRDAIDYYKGDDQ